MPTPSHDLSLVARQGLVDQVIDRLLRPDDVRESPKTFIRPGFCGVAGIGKSRLLREIESRALTFTPYVVAFDFDSRRAAYVPGTPWDFLCYLIDRLAAIDCGRRNPFQRLRWTAVNPFHHCLDIIAQTGGPTANIQSIVGQDSIIQDVQMTVESLAQPIPPNLQQALAHALPNLCVRTKVQRQFGAALGADPRPLVLIILDTVETASKPLRAWLPNGLPALFEGNTLCFHALVVAAGRQQLPNFTDTELPPLQPADSVDFLRHYFIHQARFDPRFAQPSLQRALREDTPTRRAVVDLAAGIPLLLQLLADLVADAPHRPLAAPEGPLPQGCQARIDYVIQHYVERLAAEAPDDADRAQRYRLLLYSAVPRRIPSDGLLYALFHDLPGVPAPVDARVLFNRLSRESFVRHEPPDGLIYHEIIRAGLLSHLATADPQRWRELHSHAAAWWKALPDDVEAVYHQLRADYTGTVDRLYSLITSALEAHDWPLAQALIGAAADLDLHSSNLAWLTLFKAELAWGEGNLPLVHRRLTRLLAQPDPLSPDLAERFASDLEGWFGFTPDMAWERVEALNSPALASLLWWSRQRAAPKVQANALHAQGNVAQQEDRFREAQDLYGEALKIYAQEGDRLGQARALEGQGDVAGIQERYSDAQDLYGQALKIYAQEGDRLGQARAQLGLGRVAVDQTRYSDAQDLYGQALELYMQGESPRGLANVLLGLGYMAELEERFPDAQDLYSRALELYRQLGDRLDRAEALRHQGDVALARERFPEAQDLYDQALELFKLRGNRVGQARVLEGQGDVARIQASYSGAQDLYGEALELYEHVGNRVGRARAQLGLGAVAVVQTRYCDAQDLYGQALELFKQVGNRSHEANALHGLGDVALVQACYGDAQDRYGEALELYKQIGLRHSQASALGRLGDVARMQANYREAQRLYGDVFDLYLAIGLPQGALRFALYQANRTLDQAEHHREHDRNRALFQQALDLARWLLDWAERAYAQTDPTISAPYNTRLQALRARLANFPKTIQGDHV